MNKINDNICLEKPREFKNVYAIVFESMETDKVFVPSITVREVVPGSVSITREEFRKLVSKSYMNRQKDVDAEALEVHMFGHE